ncbi:alpha/beta fold hydrolase [Amycolatopsis jiangsuensis]|uniref:2-hydroxy-6-oxonona-2,4-dienedioate hydrolase n=1 Tax=Amycolatopsis jiangsuensis TaxID=1181879 RepID=A0A840IR94_9PSEU|nr:alpha/beta hydrolase [Amycolatopsis jiangsuensis]MBB4684353.1 2-hydroxy-6-oxonona-2,4-dienedioate hydrolase [Amycolatopsis jiangsuensis]
MTAPSQELTNESTYRLVDTADYRIQVNEAGEGHPLLLIHGTGPGATGWSNFEPNIRELAASFHCVAVTMPGWGDSSPQDLQTGRDQGRAVLQLMDTMGIDRAAIVGNSMGGAIGMVMATEHPERVSKLIMMGSGIWGVNVMAPSGLSEGMQCIFNAYEDPSPENFQKLVRTMCFDPSFATRELAEERSRTALSKPEHLRNWLDLMRSGAGGTGFLQAGQKMAESDVPTLLVHGRDDRTAHYEMSLRAHAMIPDSRLLMFSRCGHWAQLEHAAEFNAAVKHFLERV